jgi:hypothetical protein
VDSNDHPVALRARSGRPCNPLCPRRRSLFGKPPIGRQGLVCVRPRSSAHSCVAQPASANRIRPRRWRWLQSDPAGGAAESSIATQPRLTTMAIGVSRMKKTVVSLLFLVLVVAFLSVPGAVAADRTANYSIQGNGNASCSAGWSWYQGGTSGTLLSSGSVSGGFSNSSFCTKVTGTTIQPSAADTISITVFTGGCRQVGGGSFTPGSSINFKVDVGPCKPSDYGASSKASFSISS